MRVLLCDFYDDFWLPVARRLAQGGLEIDSVVTNISEKFQRDSLFKNTLILPDNIFYGNFSQISRLNERNPVALSEEILQALCEGESIFLTISDRLSFYPVSVSQRRRVYFELVRFWLNFLRSRSIEAVVFPRSPHMGSENVLFYVARYLKIKTISVQRTLVDNRVLVLEDYRKVIKVPEKYLSGDSARQIARKLGPLFEELYASSGWLTRSKKINAEILNPRVRFKQYTAILKKVFSFYVFKGVYLQLVYFFCSLPNSYVFAFNGGRENFITRLFPLYIAQVNWNAMRLKRFYDHHTSPPDYSKKYVYLALHFQPERTTMPEGGIFDNQLLALDILSKSVPPGWQIFVKEHPRQFQHGDLRKRHHRVIDDYRRMSSYRNVRLINLKESSAKLIENAALTATVTGTVGWEGLLRGKACLAFGYPWYLPCRACFRVSSQEDCQAALESALKKTKKAVEMDVLKFITYFKSRLVFSTNDYEIGVRSRDNLDLLVDNLSRELIKKIKG